MIDHDISKLVRLSKIDQVDKINQVVILYHAGTTKASSLADTSATERQSMSRSPILAVHVRVHVHGQNCERRSVHPFKNLKGSRSVHVHRKNERPFLYRSFPKAQL